MGSWVLQDRESLKLANQLLFLDPADPLQGWGIVVVIKLWDLSGLLAHINPLQKLDVAIIYGTVNGGAESQFWGDWVFIFNACGKKLGSAVIFFWYTVTLISLILSATLVLEIKSLICLESNIAELRLLHVGHWEWISSFAGLDYSFLLLTVWWIIDMLSLR